jgi:hypothetical protein
MREKTQTVDLANKKFQVSDFRFQADIIYLGINSKLEI